MYDKLIQEFYNKMQTVELNTYGIIDSNNNIHTLGTDSKIIGRIFEMFTQPVLASIAKDNNMIIKTPDSQTIYPDFVIMRESEKTSKIAIDIKSTYVNNEQSTIKFTLGSYASYMRNNTKNIAYPYTEFAKHYVIGFVYYRNDSAQESRVYNYSDKEKIQFPYYGVRYFIQEKYKIAGDKPGSGNTENIGSFPTKSFSDLKNGNGPFSLLGHDIFNLYWKYYPKYRESHKNYTSLDTFIDWLQKQKVPPSLLYDYDFKDVLNRIEIFQSLK